MVQLHKHRSKFRQNLMRTAVYVGVSLIVLAALMMTADLLGLLDMTQLVQLESSPFKLYARIAVAGCVLAAIGSVQPTLSNEKNSRLNQG